MTIQNVVKVVVNTSTGSITSNNPVTLKNFPTITSTVTRLDHLLDVNPDGEIAGAVPVYNAGNDTYVVRQLDLGEVVGTLDGGSF
jgi:hypothetical protein